MVTREELLQAAADDDPAQLLNIVEQHRIHANNVNIGELISCLSNEQLEKLWSNLQTKCTTALLNFDMEDQSQEQVRKDYASLLQGVVFVALETIGLDSPVVPQPLFETTVVLQGVLLSLPDGMEKLAGSITKLCETWWSKELEGKEAIASQVFTYLLEKSLQNTGTVLVPMDISTILEYKWTKNKKAWSTMGAAIFDQADVKRVCAMQAAIELVNLDDCSGDLLRGLLLQSVICSNYLKLEQGRRFLSFLFSLGPAFIEALHKTIKNQVPSAPRSILELYGEVYFRAWRVATGISREKVEHFCIQDLMDHAVHGSRSLFSSLKWVLGYIHKQKKQRGVDEMLNRLYSPFLWRSLKAANGHVRANAAALLIDSFPLQDPDADMQYNDDLLQKQFDNLEELLSDPCPTVRVTAVQGVCRLCNVYWELMPAPTIQAFLTKLGKDLAWDSSSSAVRVSVIKGLTHMLDNHLSHPLLKVLLPELKNMLHDTTEAVRIAFLDLLLKVKGMKAIKFWSIASMEHLLGRLEEDDSPVARRIVTLIFNSFMPIDKTPDVQLSRVVTLLQTNRGAGRRFFQYAHRYTTLPTTSKYIVLLCRCVLECVRREAKRLRSANESGDSQEEKENEEDAEESDQGDEGDLSMNDTDLMAGLLEAIVIMWEGVNPQLLKPRNADLKQTLQKRFSQALPEFFRAFEDQQILSCLMLLAGFLPPNNIPTFSRSTLSKLKSMPDDSTYDDYGCHLESMCKWGKVDDVLELASEWLDAGLVVKSTDGTPSNKAARGGRVVMFAEPIAPRPLMALAYLTYLMSQPVCQQVLLDSQKDTLKNLSSLLHNVLKCVEKRLVSTEPLGEITPDEFLVAAFEAYCKLEVLLHDPDQEHTAVTMLESLLTWADTELLPFLQRRKQQKRRLLNRTDTTLMTGADSEGTLGGTMTLNVTSTLSSSAWSSTLLGSKRTNEDSQTPILLDLTSRLIQTLLTVASNMLLVGVADHELASHLADFIASLLRTEESTNFLSELGSLVYQITELSLTEDVEEDEGVGSHGDLVPGLVTKLVQMLTSFVKNKKEQAVRVLPTIKPALTQVLQSYYRHHSLSANANRDVMATIMAASIAEMSSAIRQDARLDRCIGLSELPALTAFLLGIVWRRKMTASLFMEELTGCVKSEVVEDLEGILAILHLIYTLSKGKPGGVEMKECVNLLQIQVEAIEIGPDTSEDHPHRDMLENGKALLKDTMTQLGMVA